MAYKLRIFFSGLCLFVPEKTRRVMHVLLPDAENHGGFGVHPHFALLHYDKGHTTHNGKPGGLKNKKIKDRALIVPRAVPDADTRLPRQVPDLKFVTGMDIDPEQLKKRPKKVGARVTLCSGSITRCAPGTYWELNGRTVCLTNWVEWTVPANDGDSVEFDLQGINSGSDEKLERLYKMDGEIVLLVFNARVGDHPGERREEPTFPGRRHEASHFAAYYDVYPEGAGTAVPSLLEDRCPGGMEDLADEETERTRKSRRNVGADPYQCMLASGRLP